VVFATGQRYYEEVCRELAAAGIDTENAGNIIVRPYLYRMDLGLAVADLALCRAGAMTVSELAVRGLAAVLVPSPHVAHNEQEYNARVLGQAGAGVVITEREDVGDRVRQVVPDLLADAGLLAEMGRRARALGRPHAAAAIAEAVLEAVRQR
jgi:UDP-N-acetylglucosamine--N-acetylmuramyl-(pentapeptide) pyrophosphoryl-undecaprenol N-acetylglucosamine transferase